MNKVRRNSTRARAWAVIRKLRVFTIARLVRLTDANYDNLKRYIRALADAGYLRAEGHEMGSVRWRLVRDTGPLPPVMKTVRYIYDPNTGEEHRGRI